MKHKSTQPLYIFNRENPQNSETQNGPRRGLDFIALEFPNEIIDFGSLCLVRAASAISHKSVVVIYPRKGRTEKKIGRKFKKAILLYLKFVHVLSFGTTFRNVFWDEN